MLIHCSKLQANYEPFDYLPLFYLISLKWVVMESKASALGPLPKLKLWTPKMGRDGVQSFSFRALAKASALGPLPKLKLWTPKSLSIEPELLTDVASDEQPIAFEEAGQKFSVLPAYLNNLCEGCIYRVTFKHDR
jgi:hypothetical protein